MSEPIHEISPEILNRKNAEDLAESLKKFPNPLTESEQLIVDHLIYMLTDPIERLKLGFSGQFSEEEETILCNLEQNTP